MYRGPLWIHTGRSSDLELEREFGFENLFKGGFIGSAILEDVLLLDGARWERWRSQHLDSGAYRPGYYAWVLSNPVRYPETITATGRIGLFLPPTPVVEILTVAEKYARRL